VHVATADPRANALEAPFAVIARIHNASPTPQRFAVRIANHLVCAPTVPGGVTRRLDCALTQNWERLATHDVVIESPDAAWELEYLELATHHGNSTSPLTLYILPAAAERYTRTSLAGVVGAWLGLAGLFLIPSVTLTSRALRYGVRAAAGFTIAVFGLALVLPLVSPYRIVLSEGMFAGWLLVSLAPRLWSAGLWLEPRLRRAPRLWRVLTALWAMCRFDERRIAWLLAVALCVIGVTWGTRALGGADTYGYISEADLWLRGNLTIDQAFAKEAPWPRPEWTFAPLGYRPSPIDDRLLVPVYSPGLPMLLAVAKRLGGQGAMFVVVPLCAGLLVLATFGIGRRLGSGVVGVIGAWLVATSPVVLAHTLITMTDVPVAAAWAAAFYLLLGTDARSAIGAGLLAGVAILIRPNLAPLAAVMGLHYLLRMWDPATRRRAVGECVAFGMAALPGVMAVAAINRFLFGSPFVSGYGAVGELFAWNRMPANLRNYLGWLVGAHTPVALCGLAAIFVPLRRVWPGTPDRRVFLVIGAFVTVVWAIYCAWVVFDSWWFSRFLLSSWPFIMLGVGAIAVALLRTVAPPRRPAVVCAIIALGLVQYRFADRQGVFGTGWDERHNVLVAQFAQRITEPNSVTVSGFHSGSLRYYGGRMTLNFPHLDERWLDGAVDWLKGRGIHTYALLEEEEMSEFRSRFAGARRLAALDQPPLGIYERPRKVLIFDLSEPRLPSSEPVVLRGTADGSPAVPPSAPPRLVFAPAR
jgi:hypothetical protein